MAKYKVITGIFEGKEFNGHSVNIAGESRIWNEDSTGQSFPAENCKELTECEECHNITECESVLWYPDTKESVYLNTCKECKVNFKSYIEDQGV